MFQLTICFLSTDPIHQFTCNQGRLLLCLSLITVTQEENPMLYNCTEKCISQNVELYVTENK